MNDNKKPPLYKTLKSIVKIFYKERIFLGLENLPKEPAIIVGNHAQIHGPITCECFYPRHKKIWTISQMMNKYEVPNYAYRDFWSNKPKCSKWFYKLISYVIALPSEYILTHADTLPVYKDARIIHTFKLTLKALHEGNDIIIFPECKMKYNHILNNFQENFIDVAKLYYKKYGKQLYFVPMYNSKELKTVIFGKPIIYDPSIPIAKERKIICKYLKEEITNIAISLAPHKVIPYDNVKKKYYNMSK